MTIDNMPAVKAFVEARIENLNKQQPESDMRKAAKSAALDELGMVLTLCNGLERQAAMLAKAMGV